VGDPKKIPLNQYDSAFAYIREHTEIRDVILSGGDPMMLSDRRIEYILEKLREIPHVEIIRIGSRITSHLPERITPEFCDMVQKYHPIFMNTHFNHPSELTPAAVAALDRLSRAGVSLGCQTVLLKDRLLYLLQPPLESLFAGGKVERPFPPVADQVQGIHVISGSQQVRCQYYPILLRFGV